MENGGGVVSAASEKQEQQEASYTYWVREATADAAPLPVPKMLSPDDILSNKSQPTTLGSVWNRVPFFFFNLLMVCSYDSISLNNWLLFQLDPTFRSECTVEVCNLWG